MFSSFFRYGLHYCVFSQTHFSMYINVRILINSIHAPLLKGSIGECNEGNPQIFAQLKIQGMRVL